MQTIAYRELPTGPIWADVHLPDTVPAAPGVLVFFHGGALLFGQRELRPDFRPHRELLDVAEAIGCALVSFDYRLAPETKLPAIVEDVEAALAWVIGDGATRFGWDASRVVVVGESGGGYLALIAGQRVRPRPSAIVSIYGYGELTADWYTKPNPYPAYVQREYTEADTLGFTDGTVISDARERRGDGSSTAMYLYLRQQGRWPQAVSGLAPGDVVDGLRQYEPVVHVDSHHPPTFLIHGRMDSDVAYDASARMAEQFTEHGVPHIFHSIDRAEHQLVGGDPDQIDAAYRSMRAFIARYLASDSKV